MNHCNYFGVSHVWASPLIDAERTHAGGTAQWCYNQKQTVGQARLSKERDCHFNGKTVRFTKCGVFLKCFPMVWGRTQRTPSGSPGLRTDPTEASTHFRHVDLVDRSAGPKSLMEVEAPVAEGRGAIRQIEPGAMAAMIRCLVDSNGTHGDTMGHMWPGDGALECEDFDKAPKPWNIGWFSGRKKSTYEEKAASQCSGWGAHTQFLRQCCFETLALHLKIPSDPTLFPWCTI